MRFRQIVFCSLMMLFGFAAPIGGQSIPLMIPHSGTVSVDGIPFNGPGQFKFAIINKGCITGVGCVFHWTNEKNSDPPEIEPATSLTITVTNGIFSLKLGDVGLVNNNGANMPEIPVSAFSEPETYLRIWFNDGQHDFQQLKPDRQLVSVPYAYRAEVANSVVGTNAISSTGNVGIGTTNPSAQLDVIGSGIFRATDGSDASLSIYNNQGSNQRQWQLKVPNNTGHFQVVDSNNPFTPRMTIDFSGNVGIGTSSPDTTLHVRKDFADHVRFLTLGNQLPGGWGAVGSGKIQSIVWRDNSVGNITAGWGALYDIGTNTVDLTAFGLYNSGFKTEADRLFTIKGGGNVGIGTTSPSFPLHVMNGNNSGIYEGRTDGASIGGLGGAQLSRFAGLFQTNPIPGAAIHFAHQGGSGQQGAIAFLTKNTDDNTNQPSIRAVITRDGNVGIGTTNPTSRLHVEGTFTATGTKAATVETASFGQRKLYAVEAPTVRFTDEGAATLVNGSARIELESIFKETIEGELQVHVTAYGPAHLYVSERGENYFVVKSMDGSDVSFAWSVSAFRKGYSNIRLERVDQPKQIAATAPAMAQVDPQ
jgi:hypothetical protein